MKIWLVLLRLEYEWRVIRIYRKYINALIRKGMKLSSKFLCFVKHRMDKHIIVLYEAQHLYEKETGKIIVYYKFDEI